MYISCEKLHKMFFVGWGGRSRKKRRYYCTKIVQEKASPQKNDTTVQKEVQGKASLKINDTAVVPKKVQEKASREKQYTIRYYTRGVLRQLGRNM